MSKSNVVSWFEIYVEDMPRAVKFYEAVFQYGKFEDYSFGDEQILGFPGVQNGAYASGALVKSEGWNPGKGGTTVYFNSSDCGVEEGRAVENGGNVINPKHAIGEHGFVSMIQDTEGNLIGIFSGQ